MVIVTALPSIINVYNLYTFNWISQPSALTAYNKLIPAWWTGVYPVTYYFIGCYLKEYGLKIKKTLNFLLILLTVVASGLYSYWRSYKSVFAWGDWNSYNSLFNIILTTLVFSFFINVNYEKVPKTVSKLFKNISALCFGAYLVSWIFDTYFYEILNNKIPEFWDRVYYYVLIVPVIFVCSLLLSLIVNKVQYFLEWVIGKILNIFHKKDSPNQD